MKTKELKTWGHTVKLSLMSKRRLIVKLFLLALAAWLVLSGLVVDKDTSLDIISKLQAEKDQLLKMVNNLNKLQQREELIRPTTTAKTGREIDLDHPEKERADAIEQRKEMPAPVQVLAPEKKHGLGELGKPVIIDEKKLSPAEKIKYDLGWSRNAFNQYASDLISLHRSLPDMRDPECKKVKWSKNLPTVSVVIIFHNEAWSVLLRTVHSVIDRSDPKLLKEIILVDDFSEFDHLKEPLQDYVDKLEKVKLYRHSKREGLIRARLTGASKATAEVLIFLDSHCETTEGWLEPLLDPIAKNANVSTVPVIEDIDDSTFELGAYGIDTIQVGGFDWDLIYRIQLYSNGLGCTRSIILNDLRMDSNA